MNKKERIALIKALATIETTFETRFGVQPVCKTSPFNCYLKPEGLKEVRYSWTSIHDILKAGRFKFTDQQKQERLVSSFNKKL